MSALPTRPTPPPTQKPCTATITGTGQSYTAANAAKQPLFALRGARHGAGQLVPGSRRQRVHRWDVDDYLGDRAVPQRDSHPAPWLHLTLAWYGSTRDGDLRLHGQGSPGDRWDAGG